LKTITLLLIISVTVGCGPKYSCPYPSGMRCKSVAEVYEKTLREGSIKTTEEAKKGKEEFLQEIKGYYVSVEDTEYLLRRILINRWVDQDNAVYGRSYVTIAIPKGVKEPEGINQRLLTPQWSGSASPLPLRAKEPESDLSRSPEIKPYLLPFDRDKTNKPSGSDSKKNQYPKNKETWPYNQ